MTNCNVFAFFSRKGRPGVATIQACISVFLPSVLVTSIQAQVPQALIERGVARSPKQADAVYDKVDAKDAAECKGVYETRNGVRGVLISSANELPLRWLADANGDGSIDLHCFYKDGVESYRDIDTDFDGKIDQSRWLGMAGMRWGIDKDQDGEIDSWKMISAEEASYEVVESLRSGDSKRFEKLLITAEELEEIGLGKARVSEVASHVAKSSEGFRALLSAKQFKGFSRWASFGADKPGIIPAGTDESTSDIVAYENAMAVVESSDGPKQLVIGTVVRVGDCWKLVDAPRIAGEEAIAASNGLFSTAGNRINAGHSALPTLNAQTEKLIRDMEAIEKEIDAAKPENKAKLHAQSADIVEKLMNSSATEEDAQAWTRQLADQVLSAFQSGEYPNGLERLRRLLTVVEKMPLAKSETPYLVYRVIAAEYNENASGKDVNFQQVQEKHTQDLEKFVEQYPEHSDSAEAMIQLGLKSELGGESAQAEKWYRRVQESFPKTQAGEKASGAIQRLNLVGQQITFSGATLNGKSFTTAKIGKPVIVHYWASWCDPCKADMKEFKKLQIKYAKSGLTLVGINADGDASLAIQFLKANPEIDWVQIHERGGLESKIAVGLGVFSLPATIIIDKSGKVVESSAHYTPAMEVAIQGLLK
jgi:thiol-disulfide isomerase/thioredoxin/outer membrane murein-binding lipoprotein Lpp